MPSDERQRIERQTVPSAFAVDGRLATFAPFCALNRRIFACFARLRPYGAPATTETISTMDAAMNCPKCNSEHAYQDGVLWVCPECAHEWSTDAAAAAESAQEAGVRDAHGNPLTDGDSVIVIKDLKVKGSSSVVKGGTKVRNIRLTEGSDGHNIACKIDGIGAMNLKSEFVKKA
jgi:protein PhnA